MKSAFIHLLAIALSIGVTFALAAEILPDILPHSVPSVLESVMVKSAEMPLSFDNRLLKPSAGGWEVSPPKGDAIELDRDAFLKPISQSVLVSFAVIVLTLLVSRHWELGGMAGIVLAIFCGCMAFFGVPAASGFLQGSGIALFSPNPRTLGNYFQVIPFIAPILVGAAIALIWRATRWALEPESPRPPMRPDFQFVQRACLLAAAASALTVALIWGRVDYRARESWMDLFHNGHWDMGSTPFMLWRAVVVAVVAFTACLLLLKNVGGARTSRLPWIMMLCLLPLGPESAGAFAFLLMVVCDSPSGTQSEEEPSDMVT
ncbi:MAG TPA: hypothetical protein VFE47_20985 [Tepidisphaeraceae bacterium]|jgi:hypothetical protein|nr:hypothetical protein [Tepidisphaeraceae bacterium]